MMKKKIWIINHYATNQYIHQGGRHYWLAENLQKKGYEPIIFCANVCHYTNILIDVDGNKQTIKTVNNIPFVFVKTRTYDGNGLQRVRNMMDFYLNLFKVAKEMVKKFGKPDVVLASSAHPLTILASLKIAAKLNIPCISEVRDLWPESIVAYGMLKQKSTIAKSLYAGEKYLYKKSDAIIMTWQGGKQYIIDRKWDKEINLDKVHHISNGVVIDEFDENSRIYTVEDEDLSDTTFKKVIYTGSIRHVNDMGMLLDAAKKLKNEKRDDIRILIYGSGNEKEALEKRVQDERLDNVIFKGHVEKKYIPYIIKQGDINILHNASTSLDKYGQSQNKFFEYLAAGRCIVQTYTAGFSMIDKYNCGISVQKQNATQIAESIVKVFNSEDYEEMGKNARQAAFHHDFSHLTNKLLKVIEGV